MADGSQGHAKAPGDRALAARLSRALKGEAVNVDARHVQPFLTHKLSRTVNAAVTVAPGEGFVEVTGG